ncbi:MAG: DUF3085 domain-containing protein [Alphaproteobacteria bacterium]|nr:DUF3085 domain-containing protein [Alphaproteobacteria bacterium]
MFTFPIEAVRRVIARGKQDAVANGGFRTPDQGTKTGEDDQPGFWLIGDQGVYIMSNGKLAEGQNPLVVYSTECHPKGDPDWWDYKRRHFGRDDGVEFIDAGLLIPSFDRNFGATHLGIQLSENEISFTLITR